MLPWDSAYLDARDYQWNEELDPLDGQRHAAQTLLEAPRTVDPTDPSDLRRHAGFPVRGSTEW